MDIFTKNLFAERHYLESITPEALDTYLEKGWYRMGQSIFTTHFLAYNQQFYSALWIRLPLKNFHFHKKNRKIIRRNRKIFRVEIGDLQLNREKNILYQAYVETFKGKISPSLRDALLDGGYDNLFPTREIRIYAEDELVAVSFFDTGKNSITSIMGIYNPEYSKYSLGFYTMLEEIALAEKERKSYYYPGYVVPGNSRFEYKLRIGNTEYLDLATGVWESYTQLASTDIPFNKMRSRLTAMQRALAARGTASHIRYYPLYEARMIEFWSLPYLEFPIVLSLTPDGVADKYLVVFDFVNGRYQVLYCTQFEALPSRFNPQWVQQFSSAEMLNRLLVVEKIVAVSPEVELLVQQLRSIGLFG